MMMTFLYSCSFPQGEACAVHLMDPMWYSADDGAAEKERARRQLV